jgi:hypothetical protein
MLATRARPSVLTNADSDVPPSVAAGVEDISVMPEQRGAVVLAGVYFPVTTHPSVPLPTMQRNTYISNQS